MRLTALVLLGLLLAGCAQAPKATLPGPEAAVGFQHVNLPVSGSLTADGDLEGCPPQFTCGGPNSVLLRELAGNEAATAVHLNITASNPGNSRAIHFELRCAGAVGCDQPLATHEGAAPFTVDAALHLPPSAQLLAQARVMDPLPDPAGLAEPFVQIDGRVEIDLVAASALQRVVTAVKYDGIAGPCGFVAQPACTSFPAGTMEYVTIPGTAVSANLTVTWMPTTAAAQQMTVDVSSCQGTCREFRATGASPLHLDASLAALSSDAEVAIIMEWQTPAGAPAGQQAYHVEGGFVSLAVPDGADGGN